MKNKIILWDWYLTLSDYHLFQDLKNNNPDLYMKISAYMDSNLDFLEEWTDGKMSFTDLIDRLSQISGIDIEYFREQLKLIAVKDLIRTDVKNLISKLHSQSARNYILIDNIEVWDEYFLPHYVSELEEFFQGIFILQKGASRLELINNILSVNNSRINEILYIDDDEQILEEYKKIGLKTISIRAVRPDQFSEKPIEDSVALIKDLFTE